MMKCGVSNCLHVARFDGSHCAWHAGTASAGTSLPDPTLTARELLMSRVAVLGRDEVLVLARIAERLVMGAHQYGQLDVRGDKRVWGREANEELLDGCVYLACESLKKQAST